MTDSQRTDDERAELYGFLSGVLADAPEAEGVSQLLDEDYPHDASPQAIQNGFELLREWQTTVDDPEAEAKRLNGVHTSLFIGPHPKMQAYESWYADDFHGQPLAAVKGTIDDLGLELGDLREEPDHVAVELAILEVLAAGGDDDLRRAFFHMHGWWLPDVAEDIKKLADDTFYEAVGWLLEGVLQADAYSLSVDLDKLEPGYQLEADVPTEEELTTTEAFVPPTGEDGAAGPAPGEEPPGEPPEEFQG
ncbi:hypothetical protein JCM17823_20440 [Halorubrum gandharaense]